MGAQFERRLRAIEKTVAARQPPARQPKLMFFPVDGDAAAVARYHQEVEQAARDSFFVIQIVPLEAKGAMQ